MKAYQIDEITIPWGTILSDVRILLEGKEKFDPRGGWPNIRCNCSEIFGLQITEAEVRAPFEDRPVMQVIYEVAPIKRNYFQNLHAPYLQQLTKALGKPAKTESFYNGTGLKKEYIGSSVIFSAKWLFEDIRVSLSVYGGVRNSNGGSSAAGIFIDWIDEIKAAKPFRQQLDQLEKNIAEHMKNDVEIEKFKLDYKQQKFRAVHYESNNPYAAEHDLQLRTSQMSLYKPFLFQTPYVIQNRLNDNEIGVYKIPSIDKLFVSNKWGAVLISLNNSSKLMFYEILPARGPGGKQLDIVDLKIEDSPKSGALLNLIKRLNHYGLNIQKEIRYDD